MKWLRIRRSPPSSFPASEAGAVAVEFIILFPLFLLIVVGIVEFGHLWYVDHVITNASREGARAGVVLPTTHPSSRSGWATSQAQTAVNNYLKPPNGSGPSVIPGVTITPNPVSVTFTLGSGNAAPAGNNSGDYLTVQIKATNVALVLGQVISAFQTMNLQATTTMRME